MEQDTSKILTIINNGIKEIIKKESPENLVKGQMEIINKFLGDGSFSILSMGKGAEGMSRGIEKTLTLKATNRVGLSPEANIVSGFKFFKGNHPVPGKDTFRSSKEILKILKNDDSSSLIFLLSGGSSALFEVPIDEISDQEYSKIISKLVTAGLPIDEMNAIRCQLSQVKCGQMVNLTKFKKILILAISDVPMDDLCVIGSNPFYPSCKQAEIHGNFLTEAGIEKREIKYRRDVEVTGKIILNGEKYARDLLALMPDNIEKLFMGKELTGDVNDCADKILHSIRKKYDEIKKPFFFTMCGETTSTVKGNGKGGRNCYLSTIVLQKMDEDEIWAFLSLATDGADGNSALAGFLVDSSLKAKVSNSLIEEYVDRSDTGSLAIKLDRALNFGPTGNNVSDVVLGYYGGRE